MDMNDLKGQRIAFLASGGLDSCTITHWLSSAGVRVICMTANIGQPDESSFDDIRDRMLACGAEEFVAMDAVADIADVGLSVVQAQATYEGRYWNTTGAGRVVTTRAAIREMAARDLTILSHGATGRGNDQVRFQVIASMLRPQTQFYAPWRDTAFLTRFPGRQPMIQYCEQHGLPIKAKRETPYSTDANLLGLTHEGGRLESLEAPADLVKPEMGPWPEGAPSAPETVEIRFEAGVPTAVNGDRMPLASIFDCLNKLAGAHSVGIGTHLVENRFVGVKSRGVYEAPAMELLGTAYALLMQIVLDRRSIELFNNLSVYLSRQLYQGYWEDLGSQMARAALNRSAHLMTGTIRVSLYRGNIRYVSATDVPHQLFNADGSMEAEGTFDHRDSEGFLRILTLNARTLANAGQISAKIPGH